MSPTPEEQIRDGARVEQFLADPAVQSVFERLNARYADEWLRAQTIDAREMCWAKTTALADVWAQLNVIVGDGQIATHDVKRREKRAAAEQRRGQ